MTDRELLENAATAVGYEFNRIFYDAQSGLLVWWEPPTNYESRDWNPLTNSGDAFELAVKLRLDLTFYATALLNTEYVYVGDSDTRTELHLDDLAAARRAIVRAAASIGKEMK